ncbi:hypothetical protein VC279_08710 [Xanthomonas sp. WHRI 10064A]|uniref:hypothetical protein n=1 Tax=unclassified Xanthomonas TaxID=2643310 RepID=UPI002B234F0B|nr:MULTISPECIES: hypothetical protein [unclassified Xanthomonas]MEA9586367.1 hypothetical protein [Xanthomonas sp. WHRI 10064B]MEA9614795.1 hypothetical protein [Xanthomonas sp. WHRI 10064A]
MRDSHAKFLAAGDLADDGIAFIRDSDQILARRARGIDHLCDPLLGVRDRGPFGFDSAHGAQRLQLIGVACNILLAVGQYSVILRVSLLLG